MPTVPIKNIDDIYTLLGRKAPFFSSDAWNSLSEPDWEKAFIQILGKYSQHAPDITGMNLLSPFIFNLDADKLELVIQKLIKFYNTSFTKWLHDEKLINYCVERREDISREESAPLLNSINVYISTLIGSLKSRKVLFSQADYEAVIKRSQTSWQRLKEECAKKIYVEFLQSGSSTYFLGEHKNFFSWYYAWFLNIVSYDQAKGLIHLPNLNKLLTYLEVEDRKTVLSRFIEKDCQFIETKPEEVELFTSLTAIPIAQLSQYLNFNTGNFFIGGITITFANYVRFITDPEQLYRLLRSFPLSIEELKNNNLFIDLFNKLISIEFTNKDDDTPVINRCYQEEYLRSLVLKHNNFSELTPLLSMLTNDPNNKSSLEVVANAMQKKLSNELATISNIATKPRAYEPEQSAVRVSPDDSFDQIFSKMLEEGRNRAIEKALCGITSAFIQNILVLNKYHEYLKDNPINFHDACFKILTLQIQKNPQEDEISNPLACLLNQLLPLFSDSEEDKTKFINFALLIAKCNAFKSSWVGRQMPFFDTEDLQLISKHKNFYEAVTSLLNLFFKDCLCMLVTANLDAISSNDYTKTTTQFTTASRFFQFLYDNLDRKDATSQAKLLSMQEQAFKILDNSACENLQATLDLINKIENLVLFTATPPQPGFFGPKSIKDKVQKLKEEVVKRIAIDKQQAQFKRIATSYQDPYEKDGISPL